MLIVVQFTASVLSSTFKHVNAFVPFGPTTLISVATMCEHAVGLEHTMFPTRGEYLPDAVPWMLVNRMSEMVSEDCHGSC